ncbi:thioredoxin [Candidatus Endowatersipora endosymbiont of Watersipora subatra]|uniref:thioredoxin n=1 Tax=Candidatus Endowatersipora endosymbiont of Watersipora subatra TaxID=3077946 RepID=UPI00312C8C9C
MSTISIDDCSFESDVLSSDLPVLVDFGAEWCGPCKRIAKTLEEISYERSRDIKVVKVNIDKNPDLASQYRVRSIPTLFIFKDGQPVSIRVGAGSKSQLSAWISSEI